MERGSLRRLPRLPRLPRLVAGLCAGLPLGVLGCAERELSLAHHGSCLPPVQMQPPVVRAAAEETVVADAQPPKVVPISLDTVLGLAGDQNAQIALARERVNEACAEKDLAAKAWLPNLYAGIAYFRHEGGIQNEDGTLIRSSTGALHPGVEFYSRLDLREAALARVNAERRIWQQRGELSRVTFETTLEAAETYLDLLTARTGETVTRDLVKTKQELLDRAQKQYEADKTISSKLPVEAIRAEMRGEEQVLIKLRQQGDAASAKLRYLLGLGPDTQLAPVDTRLLPLNLVDASPPTPDLVARALADGPGVRELGELLGVIQGAIDQSQGKSRFLPVFELRMTEGGFAAGPNDVLDWSNRFDLGVQARWNLTEWATARDRRRLAQSKLSQVHLTYQDLRGKLTAGVEEARGAVVGGREQLRLIDEQVRHANEAYKLSHQRLRDAVQGSSTTEVLQTIRALELAHLGYLTTLNEYNKAQLRLLLLLGTPAAPIPAPSK